MENILQILGTYEIFTNFIPGAIFTFLNRNILFLGIGEESEGIYLVPMIYFIGVIINRVGSIVLEPILRKTGIVSFSDYDDFLKAQEFEEKKKKSKLFMLSRVSNLYRSFASMILCNIILRSINSANNVCTFLRNAAFYHGGEWLLFVLFVLSYRKQVRFIVDFIYHINEKPPES